MLTESDIDGMVTDARRLAIELNAVLDALERAEVHCVSVDGAPPNDPGMYRDRSRVSLMLDFRPRSKCTWHVGE